jgi:hypothetical protein
LVSEVLIQFVRGDEVDQKLTSWQQGNRGECWQFSCFLPFYFIWVPSLIYCAAHIQGGLAILHAVVWKPPHRHRQKHVLLISIQSSYNHVNHIDIGISVESAGENECTILHSLTQWRNLSDCSPIDRKLLFAICYPYLLGIIKGRNRYMTCNNVTQHVNRITKYRWKEIRESDWSTFRGKNQNQR